MLQRGQLVCNGRPVERVIVGGALPPTTSIPMCVVLCACVCEVLPSGRRGNPHSAVPSCLARSPPILTYILRFYFFFFSFLLLLFFFFFCLLCYFLSREVPSQRGRLYIFPLFLLRAGKYYYYILKKTGEREINECRRRRHSLFDSSDSFCVVLVYSTTTDPDEN